MKKALITGASGFVGKALVQNLVRQGIEVIALTRKAETEEKMDGVRYVPYSLEESQSLPEQITDRDIDVFYHLAWDGITDPGRQDIKLQLNNIQWTMDCIQAAKKMNCKKFVGTGSIIEQEAIKVAFEPKRPSANGYLLYGSAKLAAHAIGETTAASLGIDFCWARITNAYGAGEKSPRFINSTLRKILAQAPLQFTSATQNYDFIYISDVAEAFYRIGEYGQPSKDYLIGSSHPKPLREFIMEIKETLAPELEFNFGTVPFNGIALEPELFCSRQLEEDTGFQAKVSFAEGLKKTMEWIKKEEGK